MELLLNLLWLTLFLPAALIWRHQSVCLRTPGRDRSFRAIVLLGCLLVLLFPVVSATDDLHPIRTEMEESNPSRRAVKLASAPQAPDWGHFGSPQLIWWKSSRSGLRAKKLGWCRNIRLFFPSNF